jgi:hypothetical protein
VLAILNHERHVERKGQMRNAHKILVGKPEGTRLFGRLKRKWKDNTRADLRNTGWKDMKLSHVTQHRDQ